MNRISWLVVGFALLLALAGCSKEKVTNVKGLYAPVIAGLHSDREPAVRGQVNLLTVLVTNVNGIPLTYHWKSSAGVLQDSTLQTVRWDAPDSIGTYAITVSIQGSESDQGLTNQYFKEQTYQLYVDDDYVRWTEGETVKFDPAPPRDRDPDPAHPVVYAELVDPSTGQSHVVSVGTPLALPVALTDPFFQATSPTLRADAAQIAFAGKALQTDPGFSIYAIPATGAGADTTNAIALFRYMTNKNFTQANPRFAPTGTMVVFNTDSISPGSPKPMVRDAANLGVAPYSLIPLFQQGVRTFWEANWRGSGDSVVCVQFLNFGTGAQQNTGLFKLRTTPPITTVPPVWLADATCTEPDWSPDGNYIVVTRKNPAGDGDIWIMPSAAIDMTRAIRVTSGPADDSHPRFSWDGKSIYFVSNRADRYGLNGLFGTERRGYNIWSVSGFDLPQ